MRVCSLFDDDFKHCVCIGGEFSGFAPGFFHVLGLETEPFIQKVAHLFGGVEVDFHVSVLIAGYLEFEHFGFDLGVFFLRGRDVVVDTAKGHVLKGGDQ